MLGAFTFGDLEVARTQLAGDRANDFLARPDPPCHDPIVKSVQSPPKPDLTIAREKRPMRRQRR